MNTIALLTILCLLLWAYIIAAARPGVEFVRLAVFSVCGFFSLYTVVSAAFFWADAFGFLPVLAVCLSLEGGAAAFCVSRRLLPRVVCPPGTCIIPVVIVLAALPFTWNKFGLYSMGQDQGTYQVKALALMEYDTHNYMEMEEFTKLDTPQERQKYLDFVYSQNNLYLPRVEAETETDAAHFEKIVGTIHGLPTYSALLGLWGKIFGYPHMIGVQTVLYVCVLFLVWYICENLHLKRWTAAFVTLMTASSPIVLWLSKSSLTELGIMLLVCIFLYVLTGKGHYWLCIVPVTVFAFFHISLYAFMPVFIAVLAILYVARRDKSFLVAMAGSAFSYGVGAVWAFQIAPYYSYGNYSELGRITGGLLGEKVLIPLIVCVCGGVVLLSLAFANARIEGRLFAWVGRVSRKREGLVKGWYLLVRLFLICSVAFFVYRGVVQGETTTACEYLQISTYIYMSGLLMIPIIYLALFFRPGLLFKNEVYASLTVLFLYCVVMYSMVMRVKILY